MPNLSPIGDAPFDTDPDVAVDVMTAVGRHPHSNDRDEKITHRLSGSVPWGAAGPQ